MVLLEAFRLEYALTTAQLLFPTFIANARGRLATNGSATGVINNPCVALPF